MTGDAERRHLERLIDHSSCPECGKQGLPMVLHAGGGVFIVKPSFQCSTEGCRYNRDGSYVWTLTTQQA